MYYRAACLTDSSVGCRYQTVGVTSFMLGCKLEERISPQVGDLVYITDYSSSREDIVEMEKCAAAPRMHASPSIAHSRFRFLARSF